MEDQGTPLEVVAQAILYHVAMTEGQMMVVVPADRILKNCDCVRQASEDLKRHKTIYSQQPDRCEESFFPNLTKKHRANVN